MKGFIKAEEKQRLEEENYELRRQIDHREQIIANREKNLEDLRGKLNVIVYQRLVYSNAIGPNNSGGKPEHRKQ